MTAPPSLTDQNGRPIPLDRPLASGGEGAVYTLPNDSTLLAKVYHKPPTAQTAEKLAAMVGLGNSQLLAIAAWPIGLLFHARTRQPAGFVMPRLQDCQLVQHLYNPVQRLKSFPRAGWRFQVRTALNLAAAFEEVHKTGCLIGDVNQSNALVSTQALVRLIDCDSFQVRANGRQYLCEVGVPHYTPPELQGKPLRGLVRTENHDRFGLAVLIYQLLFVGRHPYMGVYQGRGDPSFDQLIAEFRFAQGPAAQSWGMSPPPHTPTFADIPADIGGLFRRAFERGSEAGNRPHPGEWIAALWRLEQDATECASDPGHTYWRGAGGCVWCRLAGRGGPEYYFGVVGGVAPFSVDETRLREITDRLARIEAPAFRYDRDQFLPPTPPEPEPLPGDLDEHRTFQTVVGLAAVLCAVIIPFGIARVFFLFVGLVGAVVFGVWWAVLWHRSPWHREQTRRRRTHAYARADLHAIEDEWQRVLNRYRREFSEVSRSVGRAVADCRRLTPNYEDELRRLATTAETQARLRHLRLHVIAEAEIPQIGAGRKLALASNGITTAADVSYHAIRNIKGFGEALTVNLVAWREDVERRFRFDLATAVSPADQRALTVRYRTQQQQNFATVEQQLAVLASLIPGCKAELQTLVGGLIEAVAAYEQAYADLSFMRRRG